MRSGFPEARKGRAAPSNRRSSRFDDDQQEADGDWLDARAAVDGDAPRLETTVTIEQPRKVITRNNSPDIPFDRSLNAYRGCEHGCIYCFARPTHAYHNLSPGLDFETKLFAKPSAPELLRKELDARGYRCAPLALGTNTDPYQPIEGRFGITRGVLKVLDERGHPVTITTKSARVTRDVDILARMASRGLASVILSITTLDDALARVLEPRASAPRRRVEAIRLLAEAGVPTHVAVSPCIPGLTDHEMEAILEAAAAAGACGAYSLVIRLPYEVAPLFREWLQRHRPERAARVMNLIREARGGRDNDGRYFERFRPTGAYAALLRSRFSVACRRFGLSREAPRLRTDLFRQGEGDQLQLI